MGNENTEKVSVFCKHCNVLVEARVGASHIQSEPTPQSLPNYYSGDEGDCNYDVKMYKIAECPNCKSIFFLKEEFLERPGEYCAPQGMNVLYPVESTISEEGIPDNAIKAYKSASRCYSVGEYDACVAMCGKCIHAICSELGASPKQTLKDQLHKIFEAGYLDQKSFLWVNELRLIRNDGLHAPEPIERLDARDSLDFLEVIMYYIFPLNRRFEALKDRRTGK